jgi:hypothetical protein
MVTSSQPTEIQIWPIDRLVFYTRNPRKNDAAVDRMCSSIREFGFKIPVLARSNGEVIDGHLRLTAARTLGSWPGGRYQRRCSNPFATSGNEKMTAQTLRFSQLSPSRQALVRLCQDINFGQIQCLHVRAFDPVWDPAPTVLSEFNLDIEEEPRSESELHDFKLSSQIQRLMGRLDQLRDGRIERIEVRDGIPRRLVLSSRLTLDAGSEHRCEAILRETV